MQDHVMPKDSWKFDSEVTSCFSDMLSRSIPDYSTMRHLCFNIGKRYIRDNTHIQDLGCSNGINIEPFINEINPSVIYDLVDISEPMLDVCKDKYGQIKNVNIENYDLRYGCKEEKSSLILSVLTLQFTPIEYRNIIVKSIFDNLIDGGAFIFVEKLIGETSNLDSLYIDEYYKLKRKNGYSEEEISAKRKSLEGVLVPLSYDWNLSMLKEAGFKEVGCFWRCLNFAGFIAIK